MATPSRQASASGSSPLAGGGGGRGRRGFSEEKHPPPQPPQERPRGAFSPPLPGWGARGGARQPRQREREKEKARRRRRRRFLGAPVFSETLHGFKPVNDLPRLSHSPEPWLINCIETPLWGTVFRKAWMSSYSLSRSLPSWPSKSCFSLTKPSIRPWRNGSGTESISGAL